MINKKTLVLGASEKPERYSFKAIHMLRKYNIDVEAIGIRKGQIADISYGTLPLPFDHIHTVTLYLGPVNQSPYYDYICSLKPKRIIFNPGTENEVLKNMAENQGIECLDACTLVLLSTGQY
jgi:predicted CoA-binding protein